MDPKEKRSLFLKVFLSPEGQVVLRELAEFARADEADYCQDPRKEAYYQGRRSVICEIRNTIKDTNKEYEIE